MIKDFPKGGPPMSINFWWFQILEGFFLKIVRFRGFLSTLPNAKQFSFNSIQRSGYAMMIKSESQKFYYIYTDADKIKRGTITCL